MNACSQAVPGNWAVALVSGPARLATALAYFVIIGGIAGAVLAGILFFTPWLQHWPKAKALGVRLVVYGTTGEYKVVLCLSNASFFSISTFNRIAFVTLLLLLVWSYGYG
jgi:hypothetical protein